MDGSDLSGHEPTYGIDFIRDSHTLTSATRTRFFHRHSKSPPLLPLVLLLLASCFSFFLCHKLFIFQVTVDIMKIAALNLLLASIFVPLTGAFSPCSPRQQVGGAGVVMRHNNRLSMSTESSSTETSTKATTPLSTPKDTTDDLIIPLSLEEMVKESANAMKDAYEMGKTRQMVRILLPRSSDNDQLLLAIESDASIDTGDVVLVRQEIEDKASKFDGVSPFARDKNPIQLEAAATK